MFEKLSRAAEKAAAGVGTSRRGFLGQLGRVALAGAGAVGVGLASAGRRAAAAGHHLCKCNQPYYGCAPAAADCQQYCFTYVCTH